MRGVAERIYKAMYTIQADHMPVDRFTVRVHPASRAELVRNMPGFYVRPPSGEEFVFGLPIETDSSLDEDAIVLSYEVKA